MTPDALPVDARDLRGSGAGRPRQEDGDTVRREDVQRLTGHRGGDVLDRRRRRDGGRDTVEAFRLDARPTVGLVQRRPVECLRCLAGERTDERLFTR